LTAQQDATEHGFAFSGTQRTRYERLDPQFRADIGADDTALALQTTLAFDWRGERLRVFGEVMDARVEWSDAGSYLSTSQVNTLEPIQAYVEWRRDTRAGATGTLRAGRMTADLGKRRVLARSRYRNTVDSFTGIDWQWRAADGQTTRVFAARPMLALPDDDPSLLDNDFEIDEPTPHSRLFALYHQWAPFADDSVAEAYVLDYEREPTSDPDFDPYDAADHTSVGARFYRPAMPGRFSYEIEVVLQRGRAGDAQRTELKHRASLVHAEIGYQFDAPWQPNVLLQFDDASGDRTPADDHNERFDTLFGDRSFDFGPTGLLGIAARANLESPGVRATLRPRPRWRCTLLYRRLKLDEPRDEWVSSDYRDETGAAGASIGRYFEASAAWTAIEDRLTIETGFVRVAAGRFARQAAGPAFGGDPRYFYLTATTSF
jgi:hypothetical protein